MILFFKRKTDLFLPPMKRLLHIAPEAQLARLFRHAPNIAYLSADIASPAAMVVMDITNITYPDDTFDVIYCSHVLEHVSDDIVALRELYRVLKPGGWAVLQVPITAERTFEDPTVTSPEARERIFGQHDHVRRYGSDYADRLASARFSVSIEEFGREFDVEDVARLGLVPSEDVYVCKKSAQPATPIRGPVHPARQELSPELQPSNPHTSS